MSSPGAPPVWGGAQLSLSVRIIWSTLSPRARMHSSMMPEATEQTPVLLVACIVEGESMYLLRN